LRGAFSAGSLDTNCTLEPQPILFLYVSHEINGLATKKVCLCQHMKSLPHYASLKYVANMFVTWGKLTVQCSGQGMIYTPYSGWQLDNLCL
jgi:hypothetical protein